MFYKKITLAAILTLPLTLNATSQITDGQVVWVGATQSEDLNGSYIVIKGGLWSGSSKCTQTSKEHPWYFVAKNSVMESQMLSIALTSLASGKNTRIYGNGECTSNGFENIKTIYSISDLKYY